MEGGGKTSFPLLHLPFFFLRRRNGGSGRAGMRFPSPFSSIDGRPARGYYADLSLFFPLFLFCTRMSCSCTRRRAGAVSPTRASPFLFLPLGIKSPSGESPEPSSPSSSLFFFLTLVQDHRPNQRRTTHPPRSSSATSRLIHLFLQQRFKLRAFTWRLLLLFSSAVPAASRKCIQRGMSTITIS